MAPGSTMMRHRARWLLAVACALGLDGGPRVGLACTTIGVGKDASADGSTMTTHNADCLSCDFRLGRVPARDWPAGSERPIVKFRAEFPRTVSEDRGFTWTPENLDPELPQRDLWIDDSWRESMVLGHIPQVNHTHAYLEGLYAIINEKQVAIGESTCTAKWFAGPVSDDCETCNALFDISELSRIALERASTAREAIQIMGDLAVEYGFYGSMWDADDPMTYEESGEALTISDPNEVWMLHMLPDDTSKSAVWAAQRVPDDHVSVVANQFIIREVYPDADPDEFMFSDNLFEVAERGGCGYKVGSGSPLHFTEAFNRRPNDFPHYTYSTRRVWRVLDIFAPSLGLSPYIDTLGKGHPFSVKPDKAVSTQDVLKVVRDHYEGTEFDLSKGIAAGPFGDVDRYDIGASLDGSVSLQASSGGFYERAISIFRTSYSSVTQSRSDLPDEVGALLWVTQYKSSTSTYMPLYVAIEEVPVALTRGSLLRFDKEASYWAFNVVGNWAERFRTFTHKHIVAQQAKLEDPLFASQVEVESTAAGLVNKGDLDAARAMLTVRSNKSALAAVSSYHSLFETLVAKYHDGYEMQDPTAEIVTMSKMFYPKWWLELTGFFAAIQNDEKITEARGISPYGDDSVSAPPASRKPASTSSSGQGQGQGGGASILGATMAAIFFTIIGVVVGRWSAKRGGYSSLSGPA